MASTEASWKNRNRNQVQILYRCFYGSADVVYSTSGLTFRTLGCRRQGHAGSWLRAAVTSGVSTAANELQSAFTDWTRRSTCSDSSTFTNRKVEEEMSLT